MRADEFDRMVESARKSLKEDYTVSNKYKMIDHLPDYNFLIQQYKEPFRFYHNLDHISIILTAFYSSPEVQTLTDSERFQLFESIWRHDLADAVLCADLIAMSMGIDLDAAIETKFNATSEKYGLTTKYKRSATPEQTSAYVAEFRKSDGVYDYYVMLKCADREMSIQLHHIKGRAEYGAAEINHILTGSPKPDFRDYDTEGTSS